MSTRKKCQFLAHSDGEALEVHQALRDDPAKLRLLLFQGIQTGLPGQYYQARCCPGCGSTINAEVTLAQAMALIAENAMVVAQTLTHLELPHPSSPAVCAP